MIGLYENVRTIRPAVQRSWAKRLATAGLVLVGLSLLPEGAWAACSLPYQLQNGQTADAAQVMANYNALVGCANALSPAGATNSIQTSSGSGTFSAVGPLTNGQILIGSTSNAPVPATITAGTGVQVTNGPGSITISAASDGQAITTRRGLYSQAMSETPTFATTGLVNWLNKGGVVASDTPVGLLLDGPSNGGPDSFRVLYKAAPAPPYKITALIAVTRTSSMYDNAGIGWYDGSSKLHTFQYGISTDGIPLLCVNRLNSPTSASSGDYCSPSLGFSQPIWLQIADDGTNVSFAFSQDGTNFLTVFSSPKSSAWLGPAGYNDVFFYVNPVTNRNLATLMSWKEE